MAYDATPKKTKQARAMIERAAQTWGAGPERGIRKNVRAMVVGGPNWQNHLHQPSLRRAIAAVATAGLDAPNQRVKIGPYSGNDG
jgi:hypothetical protein